MDSDGWAAVQVVSSFVLVPITLMNWSQKMKKKKYSDDLTLIYSIVTIRLVIIIAQGSL